RPRMLQQRVRDALWAIGAGTVVTAWGCNALTDSTGYYEVKPAVFDSGTALPDATCVAGTDRRTLEAACTGSSCVPYDAVLAVCDGGFCPLPTPSPQPVADASAESGAAPDGGSDAAPNDGGVEGGTGSCGQLPGEPSSVVYVTGSTALASFIGEVSSALASKVTIVYQQSGSCVGVHSALDPANY